jgi:Mrp family chromosome partitioning ATPase/capsular polysaccharide biosynthesis protein
LTQQRWKRPPDEDAPHPGAVTPGLGPPAEADEGSLLHEMLASARLRWRSLALWCLVCVGAAIAYLLLATPEFVATTEVVLEPHQSATALDPTLSIAPTLESGLADSHVLVLQSERNLRHVFDALGLADDPEFAHAGFDWLGWIKLRLGMRPEAASQTPDDAARVARERAYARFTDGVSVQRVGLSYAIQVSYLALSPEKAAHLANSITAAYILDQVKYNIAAAVAQRGGEFLQHRIADAKTQEDIADAAIRTGVIPDYTFGDSDARIVSAAVEPLKKSYPKTWQVLGFSLAFALLTGVGALFLHSETDRTIRSRLQVRRLTGLDAFAVVPKAGKLGRPLSPTEALERPASPFARVMRALQTLVHASSSGSCVVGLVSCNPREGRSSIAANLAYLIADSGQPVTLLDADRCNPALTKALAPNALLGLRELASRRGADPNDLKLVINATLSFVPSVRASSGAGESPWFLGSPETMHAIKGLAETGNVIVDLPPLSSAADALAVGRLLTGVIVVAALHKTSVDDLARAVKSMNAFGMRILAVVLNDAPHT